MLVLVSVNNMENDLEVLCEQCFSAYAVLCCLTFDMIDSSSVNEHFQSNDLGCGSQGKPLDFTGKILILKKED